MAVPWFTWYSISSWRPGFEAGQFEWGFLDSSEVVEQVLVILLRFPHSTSFHHSCIHLNIRTCLETIRQYCVLLDIRKGQLENLCSFFRLYSDMVISLAIPWARISVRNMAGMLVRIENMFALLYDITINVPVSVAARSKA